MSAIVTVPDPVLRQVAKPVAKIDKRVLDIISDMTKTLLAAKSPEGVGLAAPQIGVSLQIFLIRPEPKLPPQVFINPQILEFSQKQQTADSKDGVYEGCLSLPHHYSPLTRSYSVTVKYQTLENGELLKQKRAQPDAGNDQAVEHDFTKSEPALVEKTEVFTGFPAHIIQHEMDHLNGLLFIDRVLEQDSKLFKVSGKKWEEITL